MTLTNKVPRAFLSYPRPSFWEGGARLLDLGGTLDDYQVSWRLYRHGVSSREACAVDIREIWLEVGQYLHNAIGQFEQENGLSGASVKR